MTRENTTSPAEMYEQFFGPAIFRPWSSELLELARPQPGERVLDLACGTGIVAREAAPLVQPGGTVTGVDVSPAMLAVAKAKTPPGAAVEWREANAVDVQLPAGQFDLVLCQQGLQFFPDRKAALRGVHRALKPGGRVAVSVWQGLEHHEVYRALFEAEAGFLDKPLEAVAVPFSFGDADALRALLQEAGFTRMDVSPKTREVRFADANAFVEQTILAATAVMPEMAQEDPAPLVNAVKAAMADVLQRHRQGTGVVFPMSANIALGYKA